MRYVLKNNEMRETDQETIKSIGIPGLVLMERASKETAECVKECVGKDAAILILAGIGNNGGDALAVTRILLEEGYKADYQIIGNREKASEDFITQLSILKNLGYDPKETVQMKDYEILVEGIFGVGLSREVGGVYKKVIEQINDASCPVISIDIPSGISGDTGKVLGCAVKADMTVTFGGYKRGHLLYPGRSYCGKTKLVSIGFHSQTIKKHASSVTIDENIGWMPERSAYSNKGTYGKVLVVAGNETMSGAACFAGEAALRMGAGLVKILSDPSNREIIQTRLPECLFGSRSQLKEALSWCDCILFGPGIGVSEESQNMLQTILTYGTKPLIIDADGLNTISAYEMELDYAHGVILTPHMMEGARLLKKDISELLEDICAAAEDISKKYHGTAVLKDAATIVASTGEKLYINQSGNDGMATGGSGDVLAGMIAGLTGAGLSPYEAAVRGVYLHGLAGDAAREDAGPYSMTASDILKHMKDVTGGKHESVLPGACSHRSGCNLS